MKAAKRTREKPSRSVEARAVGSGRRPLKIVIADDHTIFREGLRRLLEEEPAFRVVGEAEDGLEAVQLVRQLNPDVLLLDKAMPRMPGLEVLDELSASGSSVCTIVLTAAIESPDVVEALQRGARGVLLKESSTSLLFKCIHTVVAGQYWVGREEIGNLVEYMRRQVSAGRDARAEGGLTPRESEIVSAIVAGRTNREIAHLFAISEETVKHHLTRIYDKLGVSNRLELALYAMQRRLGDTARQ